MTANAEFENNEFDQLKSEFNEINTPKHTTTNDAKKSIDKEEKNSEVVSLLKLFTYASSTDYLLMFVGFISAGFVGVAQPLQIILFGDVINAFNPSATENMDPNQMKEDINSLALKFVYLAIGVLICGVFMGACFSISASRQAKRIRHAYVQAILSQEIGWFDVNDPQSLSTKIADTSLTIQNGMGRKVGDGMQYFSMGVSGIIIGLVKGWELALALLAFTPVIALTAYFMMKALGDAVQGGAEAYGKAGGIAEETLGNIRTVHAFNAISLVTKKYVNALLDTEKAGIRKGWAVGIGTGVMFFTIFCTYSFGMWYGMVKILEDCNPATETCYDGGRVLIVFFSIIMGAMALGQAGPSIQAIYSARAAAVDVFKVIDRESKIDPLGIDRGEKVSNVQGSITLDNVTFSYPSRPDIKVCKNYSLSIKAGETVALVGPSGSGKSTIVSLLERFYDPDMGCVLLDNKDIRQLNVHYLRAQIGLVGQEPVLFATTIAENIAYGLPLNEVATREQVIQAAKMANAYDFIMSFPQQFETEVGDRGIQLSGGQKQRIAIARAIIKDPSILLLDEATSALDMESESVVQKSLDDLLKLKKRTTIVIAHRLSTIRNADRIAVHEDGVIVELGNHDELMKLGGKYRSLVEAGSKKKNEVKLEKNNSHNMNEAEVADELYRDTTQASFVEMPNDDSRKYIKKKSSKWLGDDAEDVEDGMEDSTEDYSVKTSRLWSLSKPEFYYFILGGLGGAINGSTFPVWGVLLTKVTALFFANDKLDEDRRSDAQLWALMFLGLGVLFGVSIIMQNYGFAVISQRLTRRLRTLGFEAMLRQEIAWYDMDENSPGALTTRLATDTALVQAQTGEMLNVVVVNLVTLLVAFGISFYNSWEMSLAMIGVFPILGVASYIEMQMMTGTSNTKTNNENDTKAGALISEAVNSIRTVASFGMEKRIQESYLNYLIISSKDDIKGGFSGGIGFGFSQGAMYATLGFLFWFGGYLVRKGRVDFEEMFMVLMAVMLASFGVGMAVSNITDSKKAKKATSNIFRIIDREPVIDCRSNEGIKLKKETVEGQIEFCNVDFAYPTRPLAQIYNDYNLVIEKGKTVALVGASGSGKSTAISLLQRFYDPLKGKVYFDGHDVSELHLHSLRENLSLVSQEPALFSGTISENIAFGILNGDENESVVHKQVVEAAKMANAHDFIMQFPDGYETEVGDRGVQVSGGQKQRIALARALIRKPKVLLLDEATSALDTESEKIVQESLDKLLKLSKGERTTIIIAHRLSTIQNADLIAVASNGKIVELGSHDELMNIHNGEYKNLVMKQLSCSD